MRSLEEILAEETEFLVGVDYGTDSVGVVALTVQRGNHQGPILSQRLDSEAMEAIRPEHVPAHLRPVLFDQDTPDPVLHTSVDSHRYDPTAVDEELEAWEAFQADWKAREERLRAQRRNAR